MLNMLLNAGVIAALVFIFAQHNASGGIARTFVMLLCITIATLLIAALLSLSAIWCVIIYVVLLAVGLTFICGTQPRQTAKIIGIFITFRLVMSAITILLAKST